MTSPAETTPEPVAASVIFYPERGERQVTWVMSGPLARVEWTILLGVGTSKVHADEDMGHQDEGPMPCSVRPGPCWHLKRTLSEAETNALIDANRSVIETGMRSEYVDVVIDIALAQTKESE